MPGAPVRGTLNPAHARRRYCVRRTVERRCRRHRPQSPPVPNRCLLARPPSTVTQGVPIPSRWRHRSPRGFQTIASSIGSQGMNYVFEATVRYLFRRVTRRARPAITLITEKRDAAGNRRELLHPRPHSPRPSTFVITNPDHPDRDHRQVGAVQAVTTATACRRMGPNQTVTTTPRHHTGGATSSRPPGANSGCHSHSSTSSNTDNTRALRNRDISGRGRTGRGRHRSNPLHNFGIERLIEEIGGHFGPFRAPSPGPLVGA